ncbi:MAG: methyltransferase domain-containing protein [Proteobacteria bacterium]|nr:methyltransferase domain-containing protein [Pseudomonadota bacterium]
MPLAVDHLLRDPVFAALTRRVQAETLARLNGITGTHGLLLDAVGGFSLEAAGLGRWATLAPGGAGEFKGPLRAQAAALPFCDSSFGAVVLRHLGGAAFHPALLAQEAARVLAPHGRLIVIECHPFSAWRPSGKHADSGLHAVAPRQWKKALRRAGLGVGGFARCGVTWPGDAVPHWLERAAGAVWMLDARKRNDTPYVQRVQPRRARALPEQAPWMPGARRSSP